MASSVAISPQKRNRSILLKISFLKPWVDYPWVISMIVHFSEYSAAKFECCGCWLFIVLWRVGEHQFSSAKCPRSFHCGEHFPSSPFSQATIATKKTNFELLRRDQKNRHKRSHCCKIFHFFSRKRRGELQERVP